LLLSCHRISHNVGEEKANHYQKDLSLLINNFELFVNEKYHQEHTFVYLITHNASFLGSYVFKSLRD